MFELLFEVSTGSLKLSCIYLICLLSFPYRTQQRKVTPQPMDLEALDSAEQVSEVDAPPEQIEEEDVLLVMVEEAHPSIPEEQSPPDIVIGVLSELTP